MIRLIATVLLLFTVSLSGETEIKKTKGYPNNLDEMMAHLDTVLKEKDKKAFDATPEKDLSGKYHFGLGMWIRNNFIYANRSGMGKWFNQHKIYHPDDMSGIIIKSYWRKRQGKTIKLKEQVKYYHDWWAEQKKRRQGDQDEEKKLKRKIQKRMIGIGYVSSKMDAVLLPQRRDHDSLNVIAISPLENNFIFSVRKQRREIEKFRREPVVVEDRIVPYLYQKDKRKLHEIQISEVKIMGTAVVDQTLFITGKSGKDYSLYQIKNRKIKKVQKLPLNQKCWLGVTDQNKLLAVYQHAVFVLEGGKWHHIVDDQNIIFNTGKKSVYKRGEKLYVEIGVKSDRYKYQKKMEKLFLSYDIKNKKTLFLHDDLDLGGFYRKIRDYSFDQEGALWIASENSLFLKERSKGYKILLVDGERKLLDNKIDRINIFALTKSVDNKLFGAGDRGYYSISKKKITQIFPIKNVKQRIPMMGGFLMLHWRPKAIYQINEKEVIISGTSGVYLFEKRGVSYKAISLDDQGEPGKPVIYEVK